VSCREKRAGDADADADADANVDANADANADADDGAGKCTPGGAALALQRPAPGARRVSRLCSACASRWLL